MRSSRAALAAVLLVTPAIAVACGSRTGLLFTLGAGDASDDGEAFDSSLPGSDAGPEPDGGPPDVVADHAHDGPPVIDGHFADAPNRCPDAGATLVYVLTAQNDLYSFYPPTLTFTRIGTLACPTASQPFSMAVSRSGIAYSVFENGSLFRVDTRTAACATTGYVPDQLGFVTFGMGYAADPSDGGETFYVAEGTVNGSKPPSKGLGTVDTTRMTLSFVDPFSPSIPGPELTGTADGRLFAFFTNATAGSTIVEVDRASGHIVGENALRVGGASDAYAFAFWGGSFWIFTSPGGPSTVTRFDPTSGAESNVATLGETIVGAGVSTCAPQ